jgi:hypothetical protein
MHVSTKLWSDFLGILGNINTASNIPRTRVNVRTFPPNVRRFAPHNVNVGGALRGNRKKEANLRAAKSLQANIGEAGLIFPRHHSSVRRQRPGRKRERLRSGKYDFSPGKKLDFCCRVGGRAVGQVLWAKGCPIAVPMAPGGSANPSSARRAATNNPTFWTQTCA